MKVLLRERKTARVWELDVLRGIAVLCMVFDHLFFDFSELPYYFDALYSSPFMTALYRFGHAFEYSTFRFYAHYFFVSVFLILVGISCTFSHSNVKRAGQVACAATGIYAATALMCSFNFLDEPIIWGILQNISFNILLYAVVELLWNNRYFMLGVGALLVLGGILIRWYDAPHVPPIPYGLSGAAAFRWFLVNNFPKVVLGFGAYGSDWFSVLPCAGMTLIGGYIGKTFYREKLSLIPKLNGKWTKPFSWVGRHALLWYIAHQPVVLVIVYILGLCCGLKPF